MDAHTLKGMAIVSVQQGTKLGYVEQPLVDLTARKVAALQVKGESGTFIVPFDAVAAVGTDAITVASSAATQTPSTGGAADDPRNLNALRKLKIVDQAGTFLGTLRHVEIDPASGAITQLTAHKGGMLGLGGTTTTIDAQAILSVGPELVTVDTEASDLAAGVTDKAVTPPASGADTPGRVTGDDVAPKRE
jgi:sporulation protein YlmC with PRC-barrel domain